MPMTHAICIQCGTQKKLPSNKCANCHFKPTSDEERAKSIIFSKAYEINGEYKGKTLAELNAISARIRGGDPYEFDQSEINVVIGYARSIEGITMWQLIRDGVNWLSIPLIVLGLEYFILLK
jgi:predicted ATP-dependent serine protease